MEPSDAVRSPAWQRWVRRASGAPPALPAFADRVSERWWSLPARVRVAAVLTAAVALLAAAGAGATRTPWGPPRPALVAARDLVPGQPLTPDTVTTASRPSGLIPPDALSRAEADGTATVAGVVPEGTPLTQRHLVDHGVAGLLQPGRVAIPIPLEVAPSLRAGMVADILAVDPAGRSARVAAGARVLAVDAERVWFDVARVEAPDVAGAAAWGTLGVAVLPPTP